MHSSSLREGKPELKLMCVHVCIRDWTEGVFPVWDVSTSLRFSRRAVLLGRCVFLCIDYILGKGADGANDTDPGGWLRGGETETQKSASVEQETKSAGLFFCPWMQPNPGTVWSRKNWIYFSWVTFENKPAACLSSMSMYLLWWNIDRMSYRSSLFKSLWGQWANISPCRNHNRGYLFNSVHKSYKSQGNVTA